MPPASHEPNPTWNPHAAVAGWLIPGLGHWMLGMRRRGVILCIAILSLWLGGILIGGLGVIDRYDKAELPGRTPRTKATLKTSWWFYGQAIIAPSIAVDLLRSSMYDNYATAKENATDISTYGGHPNEVLQPVTKDSDSNLAPAELQPPYEPSVARVAEQGVLFTALAGLLNLLAIIDVLYCDPEHRRLRDADTAGASDAAVPPVDEPATSEAA